MHLWCTHCAWIQHTGVYLYFSPVLKLCTQLHFTTVHFQAYITASDCVQMYCTFVQNFTSFLLKTATSTFFSCPGSWGLSSGSWGLSSGSWGLYLVHEGYIPVQRGYMFSTRHVDTALLPCRTGCVKRVKTFIENQLNITSNKLYML